ncbi:hypothetical protein IHE30_09280 [Mycetohabitans sp. B46]
MNIKFNPFRQARQSDPAPRGNVTTSGNTVAGHERFRQGKFDLLPSRKNKSISTQPLTEKRAPIDWKTSRTFRHAAKLLKKVFHPCGASQSKLSQAATTQLTMPENELITPESEPIKPFTQVPPHPAPADNLAGIGPKNSVQTGAVAVNDTTIPFRPPKSTKRPSIPAFRPTEGNISSKPTTPTAPPRPPKSDRRPSQRVLLSPKQKESTSLREKALMSKGLKTAKETGQWLPVEPKNLAPPTGLRKSDRAPVTK